ncbi:CBS domain-containing protein [Mesorhizobium sp. L103C119B0]|uniref:CBS domain-containing protein n=1 Tax=Mesorhizobium sp. L103C119B0 TaxID=1287085 RepID=UPI00041D1092
MQAEAIMSKPVVGIDPTASIAEAAGLMLTKKISGFPVIRGDGTLVGIVSEGDFLRRGELGTQRQRSRWLEFLVSPGKAADEYVHANGRRVEEVMSQDVVTAFPTASLDEVVELMTRHHVKRIPVIDAGKVVGIITRSDLLRALISALPDAAAAPIDDEQIRQNIMAELGTQKWAGKDMVNVTVNNGMVKLGGAIFDERARRAAIVAAETSPASKLSRTVSFAPIPCPSSLFPSGGPTTTELVSRAAVPAGFQRRIHDRLGFRAGLRRSQIATRGINGRRSNSANATSAAPATRSAILLLPLKRRPSKSHTDPVAAVITRNVIQKIPSARGSISIGTIARQ